MSCALLAQANFQIKRLFKPNKKKQKYTCDDRYTQMRPTAYFGVRKLLWAHTQLNKSINQLAHSQEGERQEWRFELDWSIIPANETKRSPLVDGLCQFWHMPKNYFLFCVCDNLSSAPTTKPGGEGDAVQSDCFFFAPWSKEKQLFIIYRHINLPSAKTKATCQLAVWVVVNSAQKVIPELTQMSLPGTCTRYRERCDYTNRQQLLFGAAILHFYLYKNVQSHSRSSDSQT